MAQATAPLFDSTIRCVFVQPQRRPLSVVSPIGDKRERGWFVREVPIADSCTAANYSSIRSPRRLE